VCRQVELSTRPLVDLSNIVRRFAVGLEFHDGAPFRTGVAKGGTVGDLDRAGRRTEALDQFAGFLVHARRIGRAGREHDEGRLAEQLHELRRRLDCRQIESAGTTRDQDQVGDLDGSTRGTVGMGRRIDDDELRPLPYCLLDLGSKPRRWAVDDFRGRILAPAGPLAGRRLGIGVDDKRDMPCVMGGSGEMERQRRLARPFFWLMIAIVGMSALLHVYMATVQHR